MCGINGFSWADEALVKKMNDAIRHRGPDDAGIYVDDNVSLGHVRLSIIDLSSRGHQPMKYERNGREVWIVYNGEIYNFMEIRSELEEKGYTFNSNTDTEVILAAYLEWGFDCIQKFNGMWAFAIYDKSKNIIFLSRDRFGIKPLYYYYDGKNIIFSSEIKAILQHNILIRINKKAIPQYLMFRGAIDKETFYKGIYRLLPSYNAVFDLESHELKTWKYWELKAKPELLDISERDAKKQLMELLLKSIKRRLIADVKVGAILSGGLDSSIITAFMRDLSDKVVTFTVRFKSERFDEGRYANKVSKHLKTEHHEIVLDFNDFIKAMEEYAKLKDEPIGVPNEVALYVLSKYIRSHGVYVVLSGEGSDEIFYGYNRIFRSPFDLERMRMFYHTDYPLKYLEQSLPSLYHKYGNVFSKLSELILFRYPYWEIDDVRKLSKEPDDVKIEKYIEKILCGISHDDYHRLSYFFIRFHLPILLLRGDNSTMANAVESRVPFLDHELVEFVFSLPNHLKSPWRSYRDFTEAVTKSSDEIAEVHDIPKYLLKEIAKDKLPQDIIYRKKMGFPVPFVEWKDDLIKYSKNLLKGDALIYNYIKKEHVDELFKKVKNETDNYSIQRIWMLVSLELWLQNWGEKK